MNPRSIRDLLFSLGLSAGLGASVTACRVGNPILFPDGAVDASAPDGRGGSDHGDDSATGNDVGKEDGVSIDAETDGLNDVSLKMQDTDGEDTAD